MLSNNTGPVVLIEELVKVSGHGNQLYNLYFLSKYLISIHLTLDSYIKHPQLLRQLVFKFW